MRSLLLTHRHKAALGATLLALLLAALAPAAQASEADECAPSPSQPNLIASTLDLLDAATYTIHTTFKSSSGSMVRRTLPAIPNLPIPVDVDGGLLPIPDVLVELRLESLARVSLHVDRLITAPRRMPLRVEVVADPPTGGGDDLRVAFGYDALAGAEPGTRGEAPARFTAGLGFRIGEKLPDDAGTRSVLEPTITTAAAGDRLDLIAAVAISGSDPQRIAARAQLVPPPRLLALTVTDTCEAGTRTTDAHVDTDRETVVSGDVTVIRDGVRRDLHGTVDALVDTADFVLTRDLTETVDTVRYGASDPVRRLDLRTDEYLPGSDTELARELLVAVDTVPASGFTVAIDKHGEGDEETKLDFRTDGAALGRVEGGVAEGRAVTVLEETDVTKLFGAHPPTDGRSPAYAVIDGKDLVFRVHGLRSALFDTAGPGLLDTRFPEEPEVPERVHLNVNAEARPLAVRRVDGPRTVAVQALDAPSSLSFRLAKDPLRVEYRGNEEIDALHVTAEDRNGLLERDRGRPPSVATVDLDRVPRCLVFKLLSSGGLFATTREAVDLVQAGCDETIDSVDVRLVTRNIDLTLPEPSDDNALKVDEDGVPVEDGISVEDLADRFVLRALVTDFEEATLRTPAPVDRLFADGHREQATAFFANVRHDQDADRPLAVHLDSDDPRDGVTGNLYTDAQLAVFPRSVTFDTSTKQVLTAGLVDRDGDCDTAAIGRDECDTGLEIGYRASQSIDPAGDAPGLVLDTNAGERDGARTQVAFEEGQPNLQLKLPRVPGRADLCLASFDDCPGGATPLASGGPLDLALRFDANESIPVKLFDCRSRGADRTCDPEERRSGDRQVSTVADIEGVKFLELELRIPDPADDELPAGLVFLNTNPLLAPQDGPGGQVGELISGNSEEDFDGDGEAKPGDVFMFQKQQIPPRADGTVCDEKLKERQFSFDGASAHRRRVEFILSGDGCGPTGFNVKETSGILDCNFSQFDVDSTPGLGGLNAELCGGRE